MNDRKPDERTVGELRGRSSECAVLAEFTAAVRRSESRTLVVWGEAGVGKTALLGYLAASAAGFRVLRAVGVESEMALPFAGLHQLCAPMLDAMECLPEPRREALSIVFGEVRDHGRDRCWEWHLRKVFAKLNISSRKQLRTVLRDSDGGAGEAD